MRKILFTAGILMIYMVGSAQRDTIKQFTNLPAIHFETGSLKTNDSTAVDQWIKTFATLELPHIDSILKHRVILDSAVTWVWLTRLRAMCQFIKGDWNNLSYADTLFRHMQQAYIVFKKVGVAELSAYAKAKINPGKRFNNTYLQFFKQAVDTLNINEKEMFAGFIMSRMNLSKNIYETQLAKVRDATVISDTAAYLFIRSYVYKKLNGIAYNSLKLYASNLVRNSFSRADTLRGSMTPERAWWNVLHYSITVKPDYNARSLSGYTTIRYKVISAKHPDFLQIDLQAPLIIDSIIFNQTKSLSYKKDGNAWFVAVPGQIDSSVDSIQVFYHGKVHVAINPPWDGGWIFSKDSLNNPWMGVACEGFGASGWFPCKDHLSDEPDSGASVSLIVPDTLNAISNGRLQATRKNNDGTTTYTWAVVNSINSYNITAYIGKYVNFNEVYEGLKGKLDLGYSVLSYNLERARAHMIPNVHRMLKAFEYWMGPYPFYEDGYKLVESPYLGMEHQSAIAYGNNYKNGQDGYGDSIGLKSDNIIVHESGHEWFGNNISVQDISDMWVHEGFTCYAETLFNEFYYGKGDANIYTNNLRQGIENAYPVIGFSNVNDQIDLRNQDIYSKGSNFLQTIRNSIDNDSLFRDILMGLNQTFYHQTVTTAQIESYISKQSRFDYSKVFNQYLRTVDIPQFDFYLSGDKKKIFYRYTNCIAGFNLPLVLQNGSSEIKINPSGNWQSIIVSESQEKLFNKEAIEKKYYVVAKQRFQK